MEELGPSSFRLPLSHIVCSSATSFSQVTSTLVEVEAKFLISYNSKGKQKVAERKTPHAKRSALICLARWLIEVAVAGLLLLSFLPGQHGGIMLSSRIRRGYLKSPISFCLQCAGRRPPHRVPQPVR